MMRQASQCSISMSGQRSTVQLSPWHVQCAGVETFTTEQAERKFVMQLRNQRTAATDINIVFDLEYGCSAVPGLIEQWVMTMGMRLVVLYIRVGSLLISKSPLEDFIKLEFIYIY